ncbi:MAG TPA: LLM class F420-dependent oxidoreductase, partial [Chloroflexota bacterium]
AARYADEWNGNFISAEGYRERNRRLDALLDEIERPPDSVRRSVMLGTIFARDDADLRRKLEARQMTAEQAMSAGHVVGTAEMWPEQLSSYAKAGAERIMLQWLDLDDLEGLETIAREVLPAL